MMATLADLLKPQYTPGFGAGPATGIDPAVAAQLFQYVGKSDADTALLDPKVKQQLIDAGLLQSITEGGAEGGDAQQFYELGANAPTNFSGHISRIDNTPEAQRLVSPTQVQGMGEKLFNPNMVVHDPMFGDLTMQGNVDPNESTFSKIGWKVGSMAPAILATVMSSGMMAPMLSEMAGSGGATAGAMIGGQTLSDIAGGAIAQGGAATAGDLLSGLPSWVTSQVPGAVRGGITQLGTGDGKFNPLGTLMSLGSAGLGQLGVPSWLTPALAAAMKANKNPIGAATSLASIFGRGGQ
jgi:hypothetical protein